MRSFGAHVLAAACAAAVCHAAVLPNRAANRRALASAGWDLGHDVADAGAGDLRTRGFRVWPNRRCSEHYSEVRPPGGVTIESCLASCRAEERCVKTTLQPNASSPCYLFDAKAECSDSSSSVGWATVFTDQRCGRVEVGQVLQLACPFGTHISDVKFASFGTPTGECADLAAGSCDAPSAREIVADLCVGESACSVAASTEVFGDPCSKLKKSLAVQVECSVGPEFNEDTYFNAWSSRYWSNAEEQIDSKVEEWTSFMKALPDYPADRFAGRGIVVVAGGRYLEPALVMIKMLRELGCTLRIQVWHLGKQEMTDDHRALLEPLSVETRDFEDFVEPEALTPIAANVGLRLFQLKPLAILHSDLEEVLLLDSDNCPIRDPSYLFDEPEFESVGTTFWPDFWVTSRQNPIFKLIGGDAETAGWEQESGQLMLKKSVTWTAINLAVHLNSDFYMKLLNGDKDTFRFSWLAAGIPFHMITAWPTPVGTLRELHGSGTGFCGHTMLQHDFQGKPLFVHHNQLKNGLLAEGTSFQYAKGSVAKGTPVKSVPVVGLKIANRATVLPCLDLRGPEDPNIDDPTCKVYDSGLEEFEAQYFAAKKSIPAGAFAEPSVKTVAEADTAETWSDKDHAQKQEDAAVRLRRDTNTTCTADEFELVAPTVSTDRVCERVTTCNPDDQVLVAEPTPTSDRKCRRRDAPAATQIHVSVAFKASGHPHYGEGSDSAYVLSRDGGATYNVVAELSLTKLHSYEFVMDDVSEDHPFILTLDSAGGWSSNPYTAGVIGSEATGSESLSITPGFTTPSRLYYQSHRETHEGGAIEVVDPTFAADAAGMRFSTAYNPQGRIFSLSAVGAFDGAVERVLQTSCEQSCAIRADCEAVYVYEAQGMVWCYGLSDTSGDLVATTIKSHSVRKISA